MNVYRLRATALCPANQGRDHYDVEVRSEHTIHVEDITEFFDEYATERIYQEDLVAKARLVLGAEVTITGQHPAGVLVESA